MASLKADVERLVQTLVTDHDCEARLSKNGHWRVSRKGHQPITMSRTPSDQRVIRNILRDTRVYLGVDLKAR